MPEIIEVLNVQGVADEEERQSFTVDTAAVTFEVPLSAPPSPVGGYGAVLRGGNTTGGSRGTFVFSPNDNFNIIGIGLYLPFQFTFGSQSCVVEMSWLDDLGAFGPVTEFGDQGRMIIPFENFEFPVNVNVPHKSPGQLVAYFMTVGYPVQYRPEHECRVSMVNVPSSLNTESFFVSPFVRVLHNLELSDTL